MIVLSFGPITRRELRLSAGYVLQLVDGRRLPAAAVEVGMLVRGLGRVIAREDDGQAAA